MTTEFITTLKASGGSYTTTAAWWSGEQCPLTTALVFSHGGITGTIGDGSSLTQKVSGATGTCTHVTAGQILIHTITGTFNGTDQIYETIDSNYVVPSDAGDNPISVLEGENADFEGVATLGGDTSDSTNYYWIRAAAGAETDGIGTNGFKLKYTGASNFQRVINSSTTAILISTFNILNSQSLGYGIQPNTSSPYFLVDRMVVDAAYRCIFAIGNGHTVQVSRVANASDVGVSSANEEDGVILNSVADNCGTGFSVLGSANDDTVLKNNVAYACTTSYSSGSIDTTNSTNNAASDASTTTPPGVNPITTDIVSGDFNNAAGGDYHLSGTGSTLYHAGANLGLSVDIDGDAWDATTPSVGFDEVVAAAGGPPSGSMALMGVGI